MSKVIVVKKSRIFDEAELKKIVRACIKLDLNLIVFGLPNSGKSSLIKAICKKSRIFVTLEEEEVTTKEHVLELKREESSKRWAIGHQYPTMNENVSNNYLEHFLTEMGLNPKKWAIVKIKTK